MKRPKMLQCSCCGGNALGRQWFNRDTGYGLCAKCVYWLTERGSDAIEMESGYGKAGYHYAAPLTSAAKIGDIVSSRALCGEVRCGVLKEWDNGTAILVIDGKEKAV